MTLPQPESARGAGGFRVVKAPPAHAGPFAGYPDLLTIGHMQEITGLSNQTLRTSCASGQIPAVKIGGAGSCRSRASPTTWGRRDGPQENRRNRRRDALLLGLPRQWQRDARGEEGEAPPRLATGRRRRCQRERPPAMTIVADAWCARLAGRDDEHDTHRAS